MALVIVLIVIDVLVAIIDFAEFYYTEKIVISIFGMSFTTMEMVLESPLLALGMLLFMLIPFLNLFVLWAYVKHRNLFIDKIIENMLEDDK